MRIHHRGQRVSQSEFIEYLFVVHCVPGAFVAKCTTFQFRMIIE